MKTYNETNNAYLRVLELVEENKHLVCFSPQEMKEKADFHLFNIELVEKYGLDIRPDTVRSLDWIRFDDYRAIGKFGEKNRRTISWSDDDRHPEDDEMLLNISFPTGAYIFDEDYPAQLFQNFYKELESYGPKYKDTHNNNLYFSLDNCKDVFNNFTTIFRKYKEENTKDSKVRKIAKLQKELDSLTN